MGAEAFYTIPEFAHGERFSRDSMDEPTVILLHGLLRTRFSMARLESRLKRAGYRVWNRGYSSTRGTIEEHAADLAADVRERFGDGDAVHFVTHSLGGIVARAFMARHEPAVKIGRIVMLAPPNQGAQIVDRLRHLWLFRAVTGKAGVQLGQDEAGPAEDNGRYPLPETVELGIIAGGRSAERGYAPWIDGDNDGTVSVASTRLSGSRDHILLPSIHAFIMNAEDSIANVLAFLEKGRFLEDAPRVSAEEAT